MNWTDGGGTMENRRGQRVVVVHWDWIDLNWMERSGLTEIVPRDLADEATSEDDDQEDYSTPKVTSVLLLPPPSNCQEQKALDQRGEEEHPLVLPVSEVRDQHDPRVRLNELDDEVGAASLDGPDAVAEGA